MMSELADASGTSGKDFIDGDHCCMGKRQRSAPLPHFGHPDAAVQTESAHGCGRRAPWRQGPRASTAMTVEFRPCPPPHKGRDVLERPYSAGGGATPPLDPPPPLPMLRLTAKFWFGVRRI